MTPVLIAASYGHCDALELLLQSGGDACQTDLEGNDALIYAKESGCEHCYALTNHYAGLCAYFFSASDYFTASVVRSVAISMDVYMSVCEHIL